MASCIASEWYCSDRKESRLVTDNFLLIPNPRQCDPKRHYRLVFRATRINQ